MPESILFAEAFAAPTLLQFGNVDGTGFSLALIAIAWGFVLVRDRAYPRIRAAIIWTVIAAIGGAILRAVTAGAP